MTGRVTMKFFLFSFVLFLYSVSGFSNVQVDGYTNSHGTVVQPYERTSPNSSLQDNWSTKGNVNPNTGVPGTK